MNQTGFVRFEQVFCITLITKTPWSFCGKYALANSKLECCHSTRQTIAFYVDKDHKRLSIWAINMRIWFDSIQTNHRVVWLPSKWTKVFETEVLNYVSKEKYCSTLAKTFITFCGHRNDSFRTIKPWIGFTITQIITSFNKSLIHLIVVYLQLYEH